ncbi:MAG: hypothetical protein HYX75_00110 [Acidobacteria bacterium]|nr:hypothetical protein [Acidobacteriota bacterium]
MKILIAPPHRVTLIAVAIATTIGCGTPKPAADVETPVAREAASAPLPYVYPPPVKGHFEDPDRGVFECVDGIAYSAPGGTGTIIYVTSKPIASPVLAGSPCPVTMSRALVQLRGASYLEVPYNAEGKSSYFASGTPGGGTGRESETPGRPYWSVEPRTAGDGRVAGSVSYPGKGRFEFDLPLLKAAAHEVGEGDRSQGRRAGEGAPTPTEQQVLDAYSAIHKAARARDLAALLAAQGFDAAQIAAIRGLASIDEDFALFADRFLDPGTTEGLTLETGYAGVGGRGTNSKGKSFFNFYEFATCGDGFLLISLYENPQ